MIWLLRKCRALRVSALLFLLATPQPAVSAADEAVLAARWRGAWVITEIDAFSNCDSGFTNNAITGRVAQSRGEHRFGAGELGTVYKVDLKRRRVDVLIDLVEPLRVSRREGPFTLYDQLACRVELQIPLARSARQQVDEVDRLISALLERHESRESAETSARWNRRLREPLPDDYDATLYEYEIWRAQRVNAAVAARIDEAIEEAARRVNRIDEEPEYLAGFARGVDRARDRDLGGDCDRLLSRSTFSFVDRPPSGESRDWKEGYEDGQELVFYLETSRRLQRCFVPPPP